MCTAKARMEGGNSDMKKRLATLILTAALAGSACMTALAGMYPGVDAIPTPEQTNALVDEIKSRGGDFCIEVGTLYRVYQDEHGCFISNGTIRTIEEGRDRNQWYAAKTEKEDEAEFYYVGNDGYLLLNTTTPDGYMVNEKGARVIDGEVQKTYFRPMDINEREGRYICTEPFVREEIRNLYGRPIDYVKNYYGEDRILEHKISEITENYETVKIDMGNGQYVTFATGGNPLWTGKNKVVSHVEGTVNCILNVSSPDASAEEIARGFGRDQVSFNTFVIALGMQLDTKELHFYKVGSILTMYTIGPSTYS